MRSLERLTEKQVSPPRGVVQFVAGRPVVTEVGERPGVGIQRVGPVRLRSRRVQHYELDRVLARAAVEPEATLVSHPRQQLVQRIIGTAARGASPVDAIQNQVRSCKLVELDYLGTRGLLSSSCSLGRVSRLASVVPGSQRTHITSAIASYRHRPPWLHEHVRAWRAR